MFTHQVQQDSLKHIPNHYLVLWLWLVINVGGFPFILRYLCLTSSFSVGFFSPHPAHYWPHHSCDKHSILDLEPVRLWGNTLLVKMYFCDFKYIFVCMYLDPTLIKPWDNCPCEGTLLPRHWQETEQSISVAYIDDEYIRWVNILNMCMLAVIVKSWRKQNYFDHFYCIFNQNMDKVIVSFCYVHNKLC